MEKKVTDSMDVLELPEGVKIAVSGNRRLMTPFIIAEQGDWFEHEIRWMRAALKPGMNVLDIGANYGCYALSAANAVGDTGHVWAVEPTPDVVAHLEVSKQENAFGNLSIHPFALGAECGEVSFFVSDNPEMNAMTREYEGQVEITVPCKTLDELAEENGIESVDFLKLDAEGQETAILKGGLSIFRDQSPVVLFEVLHGADIHLDFWNELKPLGYDSYILCPGLNVLVPVDPENLKPGSALNLLACKGERAACLEEEGLLVRSPEFAEGDQPKTVEGAHEIYLRTLSYGREQEASGLFDFPTRDESARVYLEGLDLYAMAMDTARSIGDRFRLQCEAYGFIRTACTERATLGRMLSLIRVASELTDPTTVQVLSTDLTEAIKESADLSLAEPFLSPSPDFDDLDASGNMGRFIQAAVIFQKIRCSAFSCFFRLNDAVQDIKLYQSQGIEHPKIDRIIQTIQGLVSE